MPEIQINGSTPSATQGSPRNGFDAAQASNQRMQKNYDAALNQRAQQESRDAKGFAGMASTEAKLRGQLNATLAKEISFREGQLRSEARLIQQARQLQHRSANSILTPSSYQVMQRATGQLAFNASQFKQTHGYSALPHNTIRALTQSLGTEGGAFRTAAISRLGSLGQRSAFAGEFSQTVKMQKELEKISRTTSRQLQFETDPVKIASLQRQVRAMDIGKARINEGLESMSPMRRRVGMGFGALSYMMSNPAVSTAVGVGLTTLASPYVTNKLTSGVLGLADPFNRYSIENARLGRAGGFSGDDLTKETLPLSGLIPGKSFIPNSNRPAWMTSFGLGPQDVQSILGNYGVSPTSVGDAQRITSSIRGEYLNPMVGLSEDALTRYSSYGRQSGAVSGGTQGMNTASANEYWRKLESTLQLGVGQGLDQSRIASTMLSLQQSAAGRGGLTNSAGDLGSFFSRMVGSGAPGMRTGEGVASAAANIDDALGRAGTSSGMGTNMMLSSFFRGKSGGAPQSAEGLRTAFGMTKDQWSDLTKTPAAQQALQGYLAAQKQGDAAGSYQYLGALLKGNPDLANRIFEGTPYANMGDNLSPRLRSGMLGLDLPQSLTAQATMGNGGPGSMPGATTLQRSQMEMTRIQRDLGLGPAAAAGIAANFQAEGNTTGTEIGKNGAGGRGLAQWTASRRKQFEAWASAQGLDPGAYETQQAFFNYDLKTNYSGLYQKLQNPNLSAADAGSLVNEEYERPANMAQESIKRAGIAQGLYAGADRSGTVATLNQGADAQSANLNASRYISDSVQVVVTAFGGLSAATDEVIKKFHQLGATNLPGYGSVNSGDGLSMPFNPPWVPHDSAANTVPVQ